MLPSPALPITDDKKAHYQTSPSSSKPPFSDHPLLNPIPFQFEIDQNILLSPPPTECPDPFDHGISPSLPREPVGSETTPGQNAAAHGLNARQTLHRRQLSPKRETTAAHLQIQTNSPTDDFPPLHPSVSADSDSYLRHSASAMSIPKRIPSIRDALHSAAGSLSPGSTLSSPQLAAMLDITPLPSPIEPSKDPWRAYTRARSRGSSLINAETPPDFSSHTLSPLSSTPRRKAYDGLRTSVGDGPARPSVSTSDSDSSGHARDRTVSDYLPEALVLAKPRNVAVSSTIPKLDPPPTLSSMHREEYLAVQRGFLSPSVMVKSPTISTGAPDPPKDVDVDVDALTDPPSTKSKREFCTAQSVATGHPRRYQIIRLLGQGTFSKVFLAVKQVEHDNDKVDYARNGTNLDGVRLRSRRLVAIKVVTQGPAGGADAERVEVSLQREVGILKVINHPSLVHMKAFGAESGRSLLVLNYCPGGDLFEVASSESGMLVPSLVRRIFAELVSAVRYLHQKYIVHRDIKLENVLLNIPGYVHSDVPDWQALDRAVITLTDLGLSRRIPEPPESPMLTTRCGSEDYAAPELLMGQPYDGRQTDAWALGVVLYSLMEGRLPFDPLPGARGDPAKLKARTPHRIARCDWAWYRHGDEDGEWDPEKGKDYEDARPIVEGLLKRNSRRKGLDEIREMPWVKKGIVVDGGLRRVEEEAI